MAEPYPGDTTPHPEDIPNLSLSKINQLLYLLGSINGANYPADVAPHPNDTANLSLHKINRILKEGSFGGGGGGVAWGAITGDIDDQADLQARLDALLASAASYTDAEVAPKQTAPQVQALIDAIHGGSYRDRVTAAGVTTLNVSSPYIQRFTGSTTQTVKLPVTSTLPSTFPQGQGFGFLIWNDSTGAITVVNATDDPVVGVPSMSAVIVLCTAIDAESWTVRGIESSGRIGTAFFDPTGGSISGEVVTGNIASVVRNDAGNYAVVFATPEADANYAVDPVSESVNIPGYFSVDGKNTSGFTLRAWTPEANIVTGVLGYTPSDAVIVGLKVSR